MIPMNSILADTVDKLTEEFSVSIHNLSLSVKKISWKEYRIRCRFSFLLQDIPCYEEKECILEAELLKDPGYAVQIIRPVLEQLAALYQKAYMIRLILDVIKKHHNVLLSAPPSKPAKEKKLSETAFSLETRICLHNPALAEPFETFRFPFYQLSYARYRTFYCRLEEKGRHRLVSEWFGSAMRQNGHLKKTLDRFLNEPGRKGYTVRQEQSGLAYGLFYSLQNCTLPVCRYEIRPETDLEFSQAVKQLISCFRLKQQRFSEFLPILFETLDQINRCKNGFWNCELLSSFHGFRLKLSVRNQKNIYLIISVPVCSQKELKKRLAKAMDDMLSPYFGRSIRIMEVPVHETI